ncbi:type VI secretion system baseplate subunit TssK [Psychromonas sp.]|nr:type VI secretion system baseplate subunit TssK [Psychromonas sp.]
MSLDSKVVWSEGMFLNPQHFQQQERYLEQFVHGKCNAMGAYAWGISELEFDKELLKLGKLSILRAAGIFPDGTPFSFPDHDERPDVFEVPSNTSQQIVYLAIPVKRPGALEILPNGETQGVARYYSAKQQIRDVSLEGSESLQIDVGQPRFRLLLASDDLSGYATIGILKIIETREDKNVLLDEHFIATCLECSTTPKLSGFLTELVGLLHHRGEAIAGRLADTQRGGTAEIADYMMLQMINRLEPLAAHLSQLKSLHPLNLYTELVQIVGEFSTFVTETKRPPAFSPYLHGNLQHTFQPVTTALRQCLTMVYEQTAVSLPLVEKKFGIRVSQITDRTLLQSGLFVLAVRAQVPENVLRNQFPATVKVGPAERIRQLVNASMPGIPLKIMASAPRQIPYHAGYCYFELERNNEFWKELTHSGAFAFHIGADFPELELEFWSIRQ